MVVGRMLYPECRKMERSEDGKMEGWKDGRMERWKDRKLERSKDPLRAKPTFAIYTQQHTIINPGFAPNLTKYGRGVLVGKLDLDGQERDVHGKVDDDHQRPDPRPVRQAPQRTRGQLLEPGVRNERRLDRSFARVFYNAFKSKSESTDGLVVDHT